MKKALSFALAVFILFSTAFIIITTHNSTTNGYGMGGTIRWSEKTEDTCNELFSHIDNDMEKVKAIYSWVIFNIEYVGYNRPLVQSLDIDETLEKKNGICFEQASVFTVFCRIQGIQCFNVDGRLYEDKSIAHTWNRFCIDGQWYEIDITNDQTIYKKGSDRYYGIQPIESKNSPNAVYKISNMY